MLLKPKVAYAEGLNRTMGLSLFKLIFDDAWNEVSKEFNKKKYDNSCALLESVLAYHKAKGGE
jgi:CRISPR-associated protein Csm2